MTMVLWVIFDWKMNHTISCKDTDSGGGEDSEDGSDGDGALGIFKIP